MVAVYPAAAGKTRSAWWALTKTSASGKALLKRTQTRRTLTLISAPSFNRRRRMVPAVAWANSVPRKARLRKRSSSNNAKALNHNRS